jgi:cell pole-organizing protein PopZ
MHNNLAKEMNNQQLIDNAIINIRQAILSESLPNTDILELTEIVDDLESTSSSNTSMKIPKTEVNDSFINVVTQALEHNTINKSDLINNNVIDQSQDVVRNFLNTANKKTVFNSELDHVIEAAVINTLKPMLSDWLNKNLPTIVKSIVEKEIKKLVP